MDRLRTGFRNKRGTNASAHVKVARNPHPTWLARFAQFFKQAIDHAFVENSLIAKGIVIQLQRFQLDTSLIWHVIELNCREIRLTGFWANTRKLGANVPNQVIPMRSRIWKSLNRRHRG